MLKKKYFEEKYKKEIEANEAYEINSNLLGFINLLIEIDRESKIYDRYNSPNNPKK